MPLGAFSSGKGISFCLRDWRSSYLGFIERFYLTSTPMGWLLEFVLAAMFGTVPIFSQWGPYKSFNATHTILILFAIEITTNKPNRKLQQTTQKQNLEHTTLELVANRYSLGEEIEWSSFVLWMFAEALQAAPCGSRNFSINGGGPGASWAHWQKRDF